MLQGRREHRAILRPIPTRVAVGCCQGDGVIELSYDPGPGGVVAVGCCKADGNIQLSYFPAPGGVAVACCRGDGDI